MARWTLPLLALVAALLSTAAVSSGLVFGAQIILLALLALMAFTFAKGLGHGGPH